MNARYFMLILIVLLLVGSTAVYAQSFSGDLFDPLISLFKSIGRSVYKFRQFSGAEKVGFFKFVVSICVFSILYFAFKQIEFLKTNAKAAGVLAFAIALISFYGMSDKLIDFLLEEYSMFISLFVVLAPAIALIYLHQTLGTTTTAAGTTSTPSQATYIFRIVVMLLALVLVLASRNIAEFQKAQMFQTMFAWLVAGIIILIIYDIFNLAK